MSMDSDMNVIEHTYIYTETAWWTKLPPSHFENVIHLHYYECEEMQRFKVCKCPQQANTMQCDGDYDIVITTLNQQKITHGVKQTIQKVVHVF